MQYTRSGWERENAILQGLLAQGVPLAEAKRIAAQQAEPAPADVAAGGCLVWIFGLCFALFILWGLLGIILTMHENGNF